eukprot:TRINITY_DN7770_c0_g1_i10.p1 TRINITY_DN7770_c0_g1~~TRINITY_DN7770_c0_g1_i10.p1  ORF type:complete len:126 (+),score=10.63 TRINITY_DN7770_c0_g1_i10:2-379(+)
MYIRYCVSSYCFFFFKQKTAYEIMPSLVGSEMCIRDRNLVMRTQRWVAQKKSRSNNSWYDIQRRLLIYAYHLLYVKEMLNSHDKIFKKTYIIPQEYTEYSISVSIKVSCYLYGLRLLKVVDKIIN